jgi:hypothetical protein
MKKALSIVATTAVVGAVTAGLLLGDPPVPAAPVLEAKALEYGQWRLAIADRACPSEGEQGWAYLQEHCRLHRTLHGHCLCVTPDEDPLVGELTLAEINALPDRYFMRVAVCERDDGSRSVEYADLDATVPPGWSCVLIADKIPRFVKSYRPLRSLLLQKLQEKCCSSCAPEDECAVRPGSWGVCPYCLLDGDCSSLCEPPGET